MKSADAIKACQELRAEESEPGLARQNLANAIHASNTRLRAEDPGIRDIRVYPLSLSARDMLRATLAESLLIELRYLLQRYHIGVENIVQAVPDDQLEALARLAKTSQHEREVRPVIEQDVQKWWEKLGE